MHGDEEWMCAEDICRIIQILPRTLLKWAAVGRFPPPVKITPRTYRWSRAVVMDWLVHRLREDLPKPDGTKA
jgi:predicted DNA-binding transcriptional regulator AlpA